MVSPVTIRPFLPVQVRSNPPDGFPLVVKLAAVKLAIGGQAGRWWSRDAAVVYSYADKRMVRVGSPPPPSIAPP